MDASSSASFALMTGRHTAVAAQDPHSGGGQAPPLQLPASCNPPCPANPPKQAVWVVFGATGHMGRSLVRTALSHGDKVTAVGRQGENTLEQMTGWHGRCLGLLCDVRLRETVDRVLQETLAHWGRIDIVANCTGYGVIAAAEDQSEHDLLNQFSTNFMGTLHILQLSLPYFRGNAIPGRYLIFSSTAGALGVPGLAPYCATKYAVEGLIESMLYETHIFGIHATLVEPGYVNHDDLEALAFGPAPTIIPAFSSAGGNVGTIGSGPPAPALKRYGHFSVKPLPSPPYSIASSPSAHAKRTFRWLESHQPTSCIRSAEILWQLGHCSFPPLRLVLGSFAVESIRDRLRGITEEIEDWKHLNFSIEGAERRGSVINEGRSESAAAPDAEHDENATDMYDAVNEDDEESYNDRGDLGQTGRV